MEKQKKKNFLRDKLKDLKSKFDEKEKDYIGILNLLIKLFNNDEYLKEDYEKLVRFLTENQETLVEFKDTFKKLCDSKRKNEKNKEKNEEEKVREENDNSSEHSKNSIKINFTSEEEKSFIKLLSNMEKFPNKMINSKNHPVLVKITKDWIDGFIGKTFKNINNINKKPHKYQKKVITPEEKANNLYESILKLLKPRDRNKLFSKLVSIQLEFTNEEQKKKLLIICIDIYNDLTEAQKEKIKQQYSGLILDEKIREILFLNFEKIFINEKECLEILPSYIEDYQKNYNETMNMEDSIEKKQINLKNAEDILLKLYKEFMHYKNKKDSYISKNNNNIEYKIYFFLIINFINYKEAFITGKNLYKFLLIKYHYQYKDYNKFISNIKNIEKELNIYSEADLKEKEEEEKNLEKDEIEEQENEEEPELITYNIDKILKENLLKFIDEKYFVVYSEVLKKISYFYKIPYPLNSLVNYDNIQFTFNIIDLVLIQEKYFNNIEIEEKLNKDSKKKLKDKYIKNLINLEKNIYYYYKNSTSDYVNIVTKNTNSDNVNETLLGYKINEKMKRIYTSLINEINNKMRRFNNYIIEYIPFGSITQFLSGKNGDIDLFLNILRISNDDILDEILKEEHTEILLELNNVLKELDQKIVFHQTNRLCLFTITYEGVKIDINVYGICSYFGEILLREYSLMDFRFPMIVIYLKNIISIKKIKNSEEEKIYINSFAWTNILLTFLQDILDPPLFPKLLNEKNRRIITIKVGSGKGKNKRKELEDEINCQRINKFNAFDQDNIKEIKNNYKGNKGLFYEKNNMAVSEILLKFIEFIGYYFNYKYTCVNTSYEYQSFMPKIQKNKLKDIYTKIFFKKCDEEEDCLLIREPFDHTYNPCKTVSKEKLEKIKEVFREIYVNILDKGEI